MKLTKFILCLSVLTLLGSSFAYGKKKEKAEQYSNSNIYIVGVSASFVDSLIFFTDIEMIEGVRISKKTKVLPYRADYSQQLKNHLESEEGLSNRTCFVYFSNRKKKLDKLITKIKHRYQKSAALYIRQVNPNTFHFVKPTEEDFTTEES